MTTATHARVDAQTPVTASVTGDMRWLLAGLENAAEGIADFEIGFCAVRKMIRP